MSTKTTVRTQFSGYTLPRLIAKAYANMHLLLRRSLSLQIILLVVTVLANVWAATVSWAAVTNLADSRATGQLHLQEDLARFPQGVASSQLQVLEDPSGSATLDQILQRGGEFRDVLTRTPNYNF